MTFLEQPWQARADHTGTATPRSWHRTADIRQPDESTPRWYRPAFLVMLAAVAVLYLWDLSASGYANSFYAAAVQAGTENWKAWFFGSLDSSNFITVDKPPASLWVMGLSGRIFGFNSWSLLAPQALEGVAAAGLLCAAVRRAVRGRAGGRAGAAAGLIAGAAMALTPGAVLIFRFDNPDAFMVLLVVVAAYCVTRALEHGRTWWLVGAGVAFGFGFLTKSGEAVLNVPAFGLAYLVAAPVPFWRRVLQLLAAALAIVVSAGWWIAAVLLTPAADRPFIGGSTDNSPLELAFGYNGLGRLFGGDGNMAGGGGAAGSSFGGTAGLQRLFSGEFGLEISWLLPAAVVLLAGAVWVTWRGPRTDSARASLIIFGGWLLSTGITFAYMQGTIHPYYTVALAPAIGALVGIGSVLVWRHRAVAPRVASGVLALTVAVAAGWGFELLRTDTSFHPSVRYLAIAAAVAAVALLAVAAVRTRAGRRLVVATGVLTARGSGGADHRLGSGDRCHRAHRGDSHRCVRERKRRVRDRDRRRRRLRRRRQRLRRGRPDRERCDRNRRCRRCRHAARRRRSVGRHGDDARWRARPGVGRGGPRRHGRHRRLRNGRPLRPAERGQRRTRRRRCADRRRSSRRGRCLRPGRHRAGRPAVRDFTRRRRRRRRGRLRRRGPGRGRLVIRA